jgi:hypothetical protein
MNSSRFARHTKIMVLDKLQILFAATLGALCIATLPAFGQTAKPNFSGRWELDKAKSDFGSGPAPKDIIEQIDQKGKTIVFTTTFVTADGEFKNVVKLTTDGSPNTNMMRGHEFTTRTHWQGDSLVTLVRDPRGLQLTETRALSENGKVMTIAVVSGDQKQKVVMVKK